MLLISFLFLNWMCGDEMATKDFNEEYSFESGLVSVENVNGIIDAKTWDKNIVKIQAIIEVRADDWDLAEKFLKQVRIEVKESSKKLSIKPDYPKLRDGDSFFDWLIGSRNKPEVTVNFKITLPRKVDVDLESVNGNIDIENLEGEANLKTVNGGINAYNINGSIDAKTVNGGITAKITKSLIEEAMDFNTVNGGIKLYLPADINADIEISTVNGGIDTAFPLAIQGKFGPKNINGKINNGGKIIKLHTVNGSVSLHRN
jgi:hypothetical protein